MILEHFYLGCLAHASYLVGSEGEAAVIDPQRDVDIYIEAAARHGLRIAHIIETHLHADFVSGHRELAQRTGAKIYLGARAGARFEHVAVKDGDSISFGRCVLRFIETPGHTMESMCVTLTDLDNPEQPGAVFTGDTLFVGDVGRPDLALDKTPRELAGLLYDSLHQKLLLLPEQTAVYPAHGAGSLCGRQMSSEKSSTIGKERDTNYALQASNREEFADLLTADLPPRPEYFGKDVEMNRSGATPLAELPPLEKLSPQQVAKLAAEGCIVLDTRSVMDYSAGHLAGSIHIGLSGQFASWAARVLGLDSRIILVAEDSERSLEAQLRLARVGIEGVAGCLAGGVSNWVREGFPLESLPQIPVQDLNAWLAEHKEPVSVLDVREPGECATGVVAGSIRIPLGQLKARIGELDRSRMTFVHCKGGYRSSIATSILTRAGFDSVANVTGGFDAWKMAHLPVASPLDLAAVPA